MARTLQLRVVAEGRERSSSGEFLRDHGCSQIQGYLFSKPLPADEFAARLRANIGARLTFPAACRDWKYVIDARLRAP